jgi:hypothetical protein
VRSSALRWWPAWLLVAGGLLALGTRFLDREQVSYVLDEPQLQDAAVRDAQAGHWASISVLRGTRGVRYGPVPLWFYTAVHRVAGPRPEAGILAAGLFLTGAVVLLSVILGRRSEAPPPVLAAALWLAAASPFAFVWSRQGWDNTLLAGFSALVVAVLARPGPVRLGTAVLTGALLGLALGTHLLALPLVVAVSLVLVIEPSPRRERLLTLAALLLAAAFVLLPYIRALFAEPSVSAVAPAVGLGPRLVRAVTALAAPFIQTAGLGLDYFFSPDWPAFVGSRFAGRALRWVGPPLAALVAAVALLGLVLGRRSPSPALRRVARLGLSTWVLHAAFLGALALPSEPHYEQPVLWIPVAGWALAVTTLWQARHRTAQVLVAFALVIGLWGVAVQRAWMGWIAENGGTRGIYYGLTLGAQRQLLAQACAAAPTAWVALQTRVVVFPQSLRSLARTEPACRERRVEVCGPVCPPAPPGWTVMTVWYAGRGALLAPVEVQGQPSPR